MLDAEVKRLATRVRSERLGDDSVKMKSMLTKRGGNRDCGQLTRRKYWSVELVDV